MTKDFGTRFGSSISIKAETYEKQTTLSTRRYNKMFKLVVLSATLAMVAANPISFWGAGYTRPLAGSWSTPVAAGVTANLASAIYTPFITQAGPGSSVGVPNYTGPLSLASGQSANILGADGRPLDTLYVNLPVGASGRRLQKRSILAPVAPHVTAGNYAGADVVFGGHLAGIPLSFGRSWVGPAPVAPNAVAVAAPIDPLGF